MEETGLNKKIKEVIEEVLKEKESNGELPVVEKKPKEFKIPFFKRVRPRQAMKDYVTIMKLNENGSVDFIKDKIQDQTVNVDGIPRLATPQHIIHWKKNPILILPTWSVEPFCPHKEYVNSFSKDNNSIGWRLLINAMGTDSASLKKKIGGWGWLVGLIVLAIVGFAVIKGGF